MTQFDIKNYLTVQEAAKLTGYTPANITLLIREGKLQAIRRGRRYLVLPSEIDAFILLSQ